MARPRAARPAATPRAAGKPAVSQPAHLRWSDVRGLQRLASDATLGIVDLVEAVHHTILRIPAPVGKAPPGRPRGITGFVYRSVRGVTRLVGGSLDAVLSRTATTLDREHSSPQRDATVAALNGVLGDYLEATGNPLALPMRIRHAGVPLILERTALAAAVPHAMPHVVVLVHGLCMSPSQWSRNGHDHGQALARDLGCTPLYLHYNSGRHISQNGRELATLLDELLRAWPHPIAELTLIGHSMGGLVARSACHYAEAGGHAWLPRLDRLVFAGTPHFGAPMERAGKVADMLMAVSPYSAPFARLGKVRSAGVQDLGHAYLRDEDWAPHEGARRRAYLTTTVPLPSHVRCYAMAASRRAHRTSRVARLWGDGLVPVDSALGHRKDSARALRIPESRQWIGYGIGHFDLLDDAGAYRTLRGWVGDAIQATR